MTSEFDAFSKSIIDDEELDSDSKNFLEEEFSRDLPAGWRKEFARGKIYYLNLNTRRHQSQHPRHEEIKQFLQVVRNRKNLHETERLIDYSLQHHQNRLRQLNALKEDSRLKNNSDSALGDECVNTTPDGYEDDRTNSPEVDNTNLPQVGQSPSNYGELNTIMENPTRFLSKGEMNSWFSQISCREVFYKQREHVRQKLKRYEDLINETRKEMDQVLRARESFESFSSSLFLDNSSQSIKSDYSKVSSRPSGRVRSISCSRNTSISSPARECFKNHLNNSREEKTPRPLANVFRERTNELNLFNSFDRSLLNPHSSSRSNVRRHSTLARPRNRNNVNQGNSLLNETPVIFVLN